MSEMWERARVIYEIVFDAIGSDEVNTDPGSAVDRALTWADQQSRPDIEVELLLGGLGAVAAGVLEGAVGIDEARARLQTRITVNNVHEIFDDLGPLDPTEDDA